MGLIIPRMVINMDETKLRTIAQLQEFLAATPECSRRREFNPAAPILTDQGPPSQNRHQSRDSCFVAAGQMGVGGNTLDFECTIALLVLTTLPTGDKK